MQGSGRRRGLGSLHTPLVVLCAEGMGSILLLLPTPRFLLQALQLGVCLFLSLCIFCPEQIYGSVVAQVALVVKNLSANAGDIRDANWIPGLGRSPGVGNGNPLQYSCLGNPMDREAWRATVHRVTESDTMEYARMDICIIPSLGYHK